MNLFTSPSEQALTERFLRDGYVIVPAESPQDLDWIKREVCEANGRDDLDHAAPSNLNDVKLKVMKHLNSWTQARRCYFNLAQEALYALVGNELAMQKRFNINIQLPGDATSLLPVHADTWTGDSAYQLVVWVPLVDCYRTKSMYILPPGEPFTLDGTSEDVWERIRDRVKFLDVKYGEVLIFNPTLPHGNRVNEESTTRWTINCRFKGVWSPYAVKGPGEHFEPITLRAASRIGMAYEHPKV